MALCILVTGFSHFPGAPVNPSEVLVRLFQQRRPAFGAEVELAAVLLQTSYAAVRTKLTAIGATRSPDIAVHFGLASSAGGFRLEGVARNLVSRTSPDAAGHVPGDGTIHCGNDTVDTSLPITEIHHQLSARHIPVQYSDDAGAYVCNFTFYSARAGLFGAFDPKMCGLVHIPYLGSQIQVVPGSENLPSMSEETLWAGALSILDTCIAAVARNSTAGRHS
jgi:pyroglutamyl-peptidase